MRQLLLLLTLAALAGCAPLSPATPSLRLPTRIPPTPTPTPFAITGRAYYREGVARREAGDLEGALQSLTWAIQRTPTFVPAYVARGTVYLAQGELHRALADADAALEIRPTSAAAHALRGETLRLLGHARPALASFDQALALDPELQSDTFRSRWLAAREAHDVKHLLALSGEYAAAHPEDPMRHYYTGWALIEWGQPRMAVRLLVEGIETTPASPAMLWFALGQAYAADRYWQEAITSLETTRMLVQAGDTSLAAHSDRPIGDLFGALGQVYLGAGRCADAEAMLDYAIDVGAVTSEYVVALREARICQTPTPTSTATPSR